MATKLDALEQVYNTSIQNDKLQKQLKTERQEAIALAQKLYPNEVAAGVDFTHKGKTYNISETNRKYDFSHVTIAPIFNDLRAAEKALGEAQKLRDQLFAKIRKEFPHLKPKSSTKTLKCKR
jgi:hypothetical protein